MFSWRRPLLPVASLGARCPDCVPAPQLHWIVCAPQPALVQPDDVKPVAEQAAAGYGAKGGGATALDGPTTGGASGGRAIPDTGALSGTRNNDLPAGARDTNLNPPAITEPNTGGSVIDANPPQAIVIRETELDVVPVPVPVPVMVTPDVGSMVTSDMSSDTVR